MSTDLKPDRPSIGFVMIGRNEGQRLAACLKAVSALQAPAIYVDSNSTDNSVALALSFGVKVLPLDLTKPFSAARARNEGAQKLIAEHPEVEFIQFLDGDCELDPGWISAASEFLVQNENAAVVCGRRRERFPKASTYNLLCDMEWDTPTGKTLFFGGDALIRRTAFAEVGGYNSHLIAGEEPEMSVRLRKSGWEIWRIDHPMTLHNADMTRFKQWWMRNVRAGHAYAEGFHMHGASPEYFCRQNVLSNYVWALPVMWPLWPILWFRIFRARSNKSYATFVTLSKVPQAFGQLKFQWTQWTGRRSTIIEYK